ncbi:MAG: flavodoxin family protein [Lachnospiraceae bacterium]|nr:flavodoxin family protein [Lachnospiraceae bacterium]
MKILLLNGSMRGESSSSLKVAKAFIEGIVEKNPDAEVVDVKLRDKKIEHCYGCLCCWKNERGKCIIHDDMDEIRDLVMESDIIIQSFPLYFFGMPSKMKAFVDRMIAYVSEYRGVGGNNMTGSFLHKMRYPELMQKKLVLISSCGYEKTEGCYDSVKLQYDTICGVGNYTMVTASQGGMLAEKTLQGKVERYMVKYVEAGREFAENGCLSEETMNKLAVPMLGHNTFEKLINLNWDDPNVGPYGRKG